MSVKSFLDSKVVVYAYDKDEPVKQTRAQAILKGGVLDENAMLSVQVLGEFFNVVTRRIRQPMTVDEAQNAIGRLKALPVVELDLALVERAIDTHKQYGITYWDSLIVAAAERGGCSQVLSEDLSEGQRYHDILVVNPFATS